MNLLFTGASGFLGQNILPALKNQFDNVTTLGHLESDHITIDLSSSVPDLKENYEVVLHAAGKAHVIPKNKEEEDTFYKINYEGTKNLCLALERNRIPKSFIFISTVAVYGCEYGNLITEDHPLEGKTPYAQSKIMAEQFLTEWCNTNNIILTILRPSLLAGKNPPGNLGAMIKGINKGFYLNIGGGKAKKSVLMAEDIARLVPLVSQKGGVYNVCDSVHPSFGELSIVIANQLGKSKPKSIPLWLAKVMACGGNLLGNKAPINSDKLSKLTKSLTFSNKKAVTELEWTPLNVLTSLEI